MIYTYLKKNILFIYAFLWFSSACVWADAGNNIGTSFIQSEEQEGANNKLPLESINIISKHSMDLEEALRRTLAYSPTVIVATSDIDISEAEEYQVGLWPNPNFSVELDGATIFNRSRQNNADREISYSVSQFIELGGKRSARKQVAAFQSSLANYQLEAVRLDLKNQVTKAVVDVVAAQEYVKLAEEQQRIALEVYTTTLAKVQGGKISSLQEKKADLSRIATTIGLEKVRRELKVAKKKLVALWGSSCPDFTDVIYPLFEIYPLIDIAVLKEQQCKNLEMLKWDLQIAAAEYAIVLEKAQRIPDVVVTAGYYSDGNNDDGLLLGLSLPIPIFDRNQGNIGKAKIFISQLYEKKNENLNQLRIELEETYDQLQSAYNEGLSFKENIISTTMQAFEAAKIEFTQGKNDYLELLDAQRTLFDVQGQYISTLVDYHHKVADVSRLVGTIGQETH